MIALIFSQACGDDDSSQPDLTIGDFHQGGIIFYLDETGESGLVCTLTDQSIDAAWGCPPIVFEGASDSAIGTGAQNTIDITGGCNTAGIAADLCLQLDLNGFSDWFLPSQDELNALFEQSQIVNQGSIDNGGSILESTEYWTSTRQNSNTTYVQNFNDGSQLAFDQDEFFNVRAIRAF